MRKTLLFLMLLGAKLAFGQLSDDFGDGNFSDSPSWTGQGSQFFVNPAKQLQSSLSANNQSVMLSVPSLLAVNVQWDFFVQLNFDPSTSNQARIYLMSDQPDLNAPLNGYFIQIGESGSADSYDLYRQTGNTTTKIIDGATKLRSDVNKLTARIHVTRNGLGKWELYTDSNGGTNFTLEGTATDLVHRFTDWFGVQCKYTATRSNGFIFDDFRIAELSPDTDPPSLLGAKVVDEHTIEVTFSERLALPSALMVQHYATNLASAATVSATTAPNIYRLNFTGTLPSGEYRLKVNGITDLSGNEIGQQNELTFFYLQPYELQKGDLLISEILFNPKNGGVDFVEIYNATHQFIDLKDLRLANADAKGNPANFKTVTSTSIYMPAHSYWVLTSSPALVKEIYKTKFPDQFVQMAMPSYNNESGAVVLLDASKELERFTYTEKIHHALIKNVDGISLERVSFGKPANEPGNFISSPLAVGGATPTYASTFYDPRGSNEVNIANRVFSPDDDGYNDQLQIDYKFSKLGYVANIDVLNDRGVLVRHLERNTLIPAMGSFLWDGKNDSGQPSSSGIYIVRFEAFALDGTSKTFKKIGVLARKAN